MISVLKNRASIRSSISKVQVLFNGPVLTVFYFSYQAVQSGLQVQVFSDAMEVSHREEFFQDFSSKIVTDFFSRIFSERQKLSERSVEITLQTPKF